MKKIFLCLDGATVIGAGNSLAKLFNNCYEMQNKSYHFYYRNLNKSNEVFVLVNEKMLKIVKFDYAK